MKKWKRSLYVAFVCVILLAGSMRAYAAETIRFTLPVSYTWGKDGLIKGKHYQAVLSAENTDMPMPEGSLQETYTMDLKEDAVRTDFPAIVYDTVGEYQYLLKVVREDQKVVGEFQVSVMITNDEDQEEDALVLHFSVRSKDENGKKVGELTAVDRTSRDAPEESESETSSENESETSGESETESNKESEKKNGKEPQTESETKKNTVSKGDSGNSSTTTNRMTAAGTNRSAKTGDDTRITEYLLLCMAALLCMFLAGNRRYRREKH